MDESSVERDDADSSDAHDDDEIQPIDGPYDEDAMLREIEPLLRRTGDLAPTFEEVWRRLARRGWWRRDGVGLLDEIFLDSDILCRSEGWDGHCHMIAIFIYDHKSHTRQIASDLITGQLSP